MILFIDTHDELITIALKNNEDLFIKTKVSEYAHSVYTMPMIEEVFKEMPTFETKDSIDKRFIKNNCSKRTRKFHRYKNWIIHC